MSTIKVVSPANIAFIKYWGQRDPKLVLPCNDSFSMNLSGCTTTLELEIIDDKMVQEMEIQLFGNTDYQSATPAQLHKVSEFYKTAKIFLHETKDFGFKIRSSNSFPMKAGIASSAAFFSALALAFSHGFNRELSQRELSVLARLSGSGSACRSVPDGFVWWHKGEFSADSYAESIAPPDYWDIVDLVLVVSTDEKKTGSQEGHGGAQSSPMFAPRLEKLHERALDMKQAFMDKDFTKFGMLVQQEALEFTHVLKTQQPPLDYRTAETHACVAELETVRKQGVEGYFTIDAGANLHVICEKKQASELTAHFQNVPGVKHIISNKACQGARII